MVRRKMSAIKNATTQSKPSKAYPHKKTGKWMSDSMPSRLIDEEDDVVFGELLKAQKNAKGKAKVTEVEKPTKKRATGPKLMADAMPNKRRVQMEIPTEPSTDEETLLRTPPCSDSNTYEGFLFIRMLFLEFCFGATGSV